jgi:hypothetical protein
VDFSLLLLLILSHLFIDNDGLYKDTIFQAYGRMAYFLAHGGLATFSYLVLVGGMPIKVTSQVACATDMMLFGCH